MRWVFLQRPECFLGLWPSWPLQSRGLFLLTVGSLAPLSIARTFEYKVANLRSTRPLNWGVPGPVYSNWMPKPCLAHSRSKEPISPALSHRMYLTNTLCLEASSLINVIILSTWLLFLLKNVLHATYVQSSTTSSHNLEFGKSVA
jgi:hypothetical protein